LTRTREVATQGGLVLLTPGSTTGGTQGASGGITFSAASSVSIDNIFTSTYDNYRIMLNYNGTNGAALNLRFRTNGVDNSSASYAYSLMRLGMNGSQYNTVNSGSATSYLLNHTWAGANAVNLDFSKPFASLRTIVSGNILGTDSTTAAIDGGLNVGYYTAEVSFTGFSLIPASGTITGDIQVYGYKK